MAERKARTVVLSLESWRCLTEMALDAGGSRSDVLEGLILAARAGDRLPVAEAMRVEACRPVPAETPGATAPIVSLPQPLTGPAKDAAFEELKASFDSRSGDGEFDEAEEEPRRQKLNPLSCHIETDGLYEMPFWREADGRIVDDVGRELPKRVCADLAKAELRGSVRWEDV